MSNTAAVKILGEPEVSVPFWKRIFGAQKNGKKLSVNPKAFAISVGVLSAVIVVIQMVLDGARQAPVGSSMGSADLGNTASVSQIISIPQENLARSADETAKGHRSAKQRTKYTGPQLISRPRDLGNIPPGVLFWAKLIGGASNGIVRAEVTKELAVNGESKIPSGSVLVGSGSSNEDRLKVRFDSVVFKDGTIAQFSAEGCDKSDKIPGLKGSVVGNKALNIAGSIGLGFLGGFSEGLQETQGQQGAVIRKPSVKNALLNATAHTALEQSQNLMSDLKSRTPVIEVPEGTDICVIAVGGNG